MIEISFLYGPLYFPQRQLYFSYLQPIILLLLTPGDEICKCKSGIVLFNLSVVLCISYNRYIIRFSSPDRQNVCFRFLFSYFLFEFVVLC